MKNLILASGSPRRIELMKNAGYTFEVIKSAADESYDSSLDPSMVPAILSKRKALNVFETQNIFPKEDVIVIGADTIVVIDDKILGKPKDTQQAIDMLSMLQGREHLVYTGMNFIYFDNGEIKNYSETCCTRVFIDSLSPDEIINYIKTKECMDKAGSYAIQGIFAKHITKILGDYYNVVGLPINRVYKIINKIQN